MSGFFSLGGISKDEEESVITPNSLYLFKNEEIYSKGFELWQQYYQLHQQQQQRQHNDLCLNNSNNPYGSSWRVMRPGGGGYGFSGSGGGGGGGVNCQDCGNQAKKDCQHMRCRTCCKSRGFQCQTHVKSTWVPAAKRRERQQQLASLTQQQQQQHDLGNQQLSLMMRGGSSGADQNPKRLRGDHLVATVAGGGAVVANLPSSTHHHNTCSALEMGHFPAEVSSPALFRCVRVSAMDEEEEEEQLAYQTAVNIGGHVFKGILYDHGVEGGGYNHPGSSATGTQQLNLITTTAATVNPNVDPATIYPTPLNAFMAGTQFFPPPRS
ncbi:hypothetical protein SSX86_007614 [Deinandra increscens subsp. villosa]|uniref:Protein SHI RELATED SEQUENCE 1-like n=1 Tax=Deinandra increscens subsp. villosa TaxID=3103831 RepID=A0AAP0H840_9ASTR